MPKPTVGNQELAILRYVVDHAPISVRDVATQFGEPQGLARTTILTVMERLRAKGYLTRVQEQGIYLYAPPVPKADLLRQLVGDFVEKALGGSLWPFAAYLAEARNISQSEIDELRKVVETLEVEALETEETETSEKPASSEPASTK